MILHIDMDAFYASVEIRDNPDLANLPVVVGGSPKGRGVISAASYEARKFGLHSAMPAAQAIRLCPNALFIKPRMEYYASISKQIREIFFRFTSLVEPLSLDEAFLDVTGCEGLFGPAPEIAKQVKRTILDETGLIASAGVAPNKFLAKVASDLDKPDGLVIVPHDGIDQFLEPLEIGRIWGVGKKTLQKFHRIGVHTVAQLKAVPREHLQQLFGLNSDHFWRLARGLDTRPVVPDRIAKSISHENTFSRDIHDVEALSAWVHELANQVGRRLRRHEIYGRTVQLKLRFSDFHTITRAQTLSRPTDSSNEISTVARELLEKVEIDERGIRLLGVGVSNLDREKVQQQMLFDQEDREKQGRLERATDTIKDKFGSLSVRPASSMKHGVRARPKVDDN